MTRYPTLLLALLSGCSLNTDPGGRGPQGLPGDPSGLPQELSDGDPTTTPVSWSDLSGVPENFPPAPHGHGACEGTEKVTGIDSSGQVTCADDVSMTYTPGPGVLLDGSAFSVDFAGSGTANTVARSDHTHAPPVYADLPVDEIIAGVTAALADRLLPLGCTDGDVLVRTAMGWTCSSNPPCPPGYAQAVDGIYKICVRTIVFYEYGIQKTLSDEMVKASNFWIDRYESTDHAGYVGEWVAGQCQCANSNAPCRPCANGYNATVIALPPGAPSPSRAISSKGEEPVDTITWFQAATLCANAGKRLCTNVEWQTAVIGTPDPGPTTEGEECNVDFGAASVTGSQSGCVSQIGSFDMIGNVAEWVADWFAAPGTDLVAQAPYATWSAEYGDDYVSNVAGTAYDPNFGGYGQRRPAGAVRGGFYGHGQKAGAFAIDLNSAPSDMGPGVGTRCCIDGR